jgi:hypothetical protein
MGYPEYSPIKKGCQIAARTLQPVGETCSIFSAHMGDAVMTEKEGMTWFKNQFRSPVQAAIAGTPLKLDLIAAIATQESYGDAWGLIYKTMPVDEVLKRCVGDTLDYPDGPQPFRKIKPH